MFEILAMLGIGFVGSVHCLGMCGPLVLAHSLHLKRPAIGTGPGSVFSWRNGVSHHLAFHLGRLLTYGLLGALGAALFQAADLGLLLLKIRPGMTVAGGVLLVAMGLVLLEVVPLPAFLGSAAGSSFSALGSRFHFLLQSPGAVSKVGLGMMAGLVPCCLSWAMVLSAASTLDPVKGFLSMAAFGLGTVPALFSVGVSSSYLTHRIRFLGERAAAISVIVMGVLLLMRGVELLA